MSPFDLPHIGFLVAAYAVAVIVVALLIGSIVVDHRSLRRALAAYATKAVGEADPDGVSP
ncbi:heme exporter protein CcmD [Rhizobiales bacterium GAS191]|nr:heme exporter protein CcmD [Rhizobiales bacterium GAS191]